MVLIILFQVYGITGVAVWPPYLALPVSNLFHDNGNISTHSRGRRDADTTLHNNETAPSGAHGSLQRAQAIPLYNQSADIASRNSVVVRIGDGYVEMCLMVASMLASSCSPMGKWTHAYTAYLCFGYKICQKPQLFTNKNYVGNSLGVNVLSTCKIFCQPVSY